MKTTKGFKYCEHCDAPTDDVSPPTSEQYESGQIDIGDRSTVLLPKRLAKRKGTHAKSLAGIYCDSDCLNKHITAILAGKV